MRTYKDPYMNFVMTPPAQEQTKFDMYESRVGDMQVVSDRGRSNIGGGVGLGELPLPTSGIWSNEQYSWMPIVIIVVSAMALITLYAVVMKR